MKMKTTLVVFLTLVLFVFAGCGTYTISSNDLIDSGEKLIKEGALIFRPAKLTLINPYYGIDFTAVVDGNPVIIPARSFICVNVRVNMLADGTIMPVPIAVIPPSNAFNSEAQNWNVQSRSSSSVWVIQVTETWISLRRSS